jgi:hypothetical protein
MLNAEKKPKVDPGTRIELISMDDPYTKLEPGLKGSVIHTDDLGTIHMKWDNGSTLGLIPGEDRYKVINEDDNRYRPFPEERDPEIGERNNQLYKQAEAEEHLDTEAIDEESETEEEVDPYEGKERRFRVSFYMDVHVPMTANIEHDKELAEQEASNILKKLNQKTVSNAFIGGVAHHPYSTMPDKKEFSNL